MPPLYSVFWKKGADSGCSLFASCLEDIKPLLRSVVPPGAKVLSIQQAEWEDEF